MFRTPSMDAVAALMREAAAAYVQPRFRALADHHVQEKAPGELVTIADHEAEAWLSPRLAALLPGSRVVGEEAAAATPELLQGLDEGAVWLVDPLDGTSNFVKGRADFAMLVSLMRQGEPVAAWLYAPHHDQFCQAEAGAGAWRDDGTRLRIAPSGGRISGLTKWYALPPSLREAVSAAWLPHTDLAQGTGATGCDYPALVESRWHYMLFWNLLPWDHAPGSLLATEAGGHVAHLDGQPYRPALNTRGLLVAQDRDAWSQLRGLLPSALPLG
jgi:fructose-1,6-bisphosphatase/inositol monophosphatase family enzyme